MKIELNTPTLALPRDGLIALRDAEGTRVTTLAGSAVDYPGQRGRAT